MSAIFIVLHRCRPVRFVEPIRPTFELVAPLEATQFISEPLAFGAIKDYGLHLDLTEVVPLNEAIENPS